MLGFVVYPGVSALEVHSGDEPFADESIVHFGALRNRRTHLYCWIEQIRWGHEGAPALPRSSQVVVGYELAILSLLFGDFLAESEELGAIVKRGRMYHEYGASTPL